jgi:hypothetical protein
MFLRRAGSRGPSIAAAATPSGGKGGAPNRGLNGWSGADPLDATTDMTVAGAAVTAAPRSGRCFPRPLSMAFDLYERQHWATAILDLVGIERWWHLRNAAHLARSGYPRQEIRPAPPSSGRATMQAGEDTAAARHCQPSGKTLAGRSYSGLIQLVSLALLGPVSGIGKLSPTVDHATAILRMRGSAGKPN